MLPPEALVTKDQVNPVPDPPLAEKVAFPRRGKVIAAGETVTPGPTAMVFVRMFPAESSTSTMSVPFGFGPAV